MNDRLVLASSSEIRATLLRNAGVPIEVVPARIDEENLRYSLQQEHVPPRDVADALAEAKARKVSNRKPGCLVLGCDQVLEVDGTVLGKAATVEEARQQLELLKDKTHRLLSAAVLYRDGEPQWRHVGVVRIATRRYSNTYIEAYLDRNWSSIKHSVGCYKLEEEGARLIKRVDGDYFHVLGLPLLELLAYLTVLEFLPG